MALHHRCRTWPQPLLIVPTLCVGMPQRTLCVRFWDAERPGLHSHAERGNDQSAATKKATFSGRLFVGLRNYCPL
ncbi:hypothetical protein EYC95_18060 [Pseudomonas sp. BGI-2]|nr:hypothetical protein EYC95_18060 [Pseudomonas sp. BGI-2]